MKKYPWMFDINLYLSMFFTVLGIYRLYTGGDYGELFTALSVCHGIIFRVNRLEWMLENRDEYKRV